MNPVIAYELGYITFSELENGLWNFTLDEIFEIGEYHYSFYLSRVNGLHENTYYIKKFGSDLNAESEWFCE
ncbi:hypothetical protein [Enterococcus gilvus]|uniref:hypothetical protein n=1 Tax=Enterococcus gilvus TaxID=160453 RepID=UPI001C8B0D27|nr:hypothetical protein [Enterococcus gilvus]MBX8938456.1 hypothetical protein [Enterococcus gilvus]